MDILHKDTITVENQSGIREQRLVADSTLVDLPTDNNFWQGIGNFVYLADIEFKPNGETKCHRYYDMDIISFMLSGNLIHEGFLEQNQLHTHYDIMVQRAGSEGIKLHEINPDNCWNRILQMRVLPERQGYPSECKTFHPEPEGLTRIYGGNRDQYTSFPAKTLVDVALLKPKQYLSINENFMAYLSIGSATINNQDVHEGTLIKGQQFKIEALENCHIIIVRLAEEI